MAKALEKKRRLGQYAAIWRGGKPVFIGEDAPMNTSIEVVKVDGERQQILQPEVTRHAQIHVATSAGAGCRE